MNLAKEGERTGKRRIATIGMFDGVHCGHKFLLSNLRARSGERGLSPTVVTFRGHPAAVINPQAAPKMLLTLEERLQALEKEGVKECILLDFDSDMRNLDARGFLGLLREKYAVAALIVGFNNRFGHDRIEGLEQYMEIGNELGIEVIAGAELKKEGESISASKIRELLLRGRINEANSALGYNYFLNGSVIHGKRLGRELGFPTANILVADREKLIPGNGVYAVAIQLDDDKRKYPGMLNIGHRPTVEDDGAPLSIEAHLLDFSREIYGKGIKIEFIGFIRAERRFSTKGELTRQLQADSVTARGMLNDRRAL